MKPDTHKMEYEMNCKIGDIAVIIRGPNFGKLVTVLEPSRDYGYRFWRVQSLGGVLPTRNGRPPGMIGHIEDERLKPLRDTPGEDETLRVREIAAQ